MDRLCRLVGLAVGAALTDVVARTRPTGTLLPSAVARAVGCRGDQDWRCDRIFDA